MYNPGHPNNNNNNGEWDPAHPGDTAQLLPNDPQCDWLLSSRGWQFDWLKNDDDDETTTGINRDDPVSVGDRADFLRLLQETSDFTEKLIEKRPNVDERDAPSVETVIHLIDLVKDCLMHVYKIYDFLSRNRRREDDWSAKSNSPSAEDQRDNGDAAVIEENPATAKRTIYCIMNGIFFSNELFRSPHHDEIDVRNDKIPTDPNVAAADNPSHFIKEFSYLICNENGPFAQDSVMFAYKYPVRKNGGKPNDVQEKILNYMRAASGMELTEGVKRNAEHYVAHNVIKKVLLFQLRKLDEFAGKSQSKAVEIKIFVPGKRNYNFVRKCMDSLAGGGGDDDDDAVAAAISRLELIDAYERYPHLFRDHHMKMLKSIYSLNDCKRQVKTGNEKIVICANHRDDKFDGNVKILCSALALYSLWEHLQNHGIV